MSSAPVLRSMPRVFAWLPRALLLMLMLAAPVLAAPAIADQPRHIIEAHESPNTGVGFVLLMSLRRG